MSPDVLRRQLSQLRRYLDDLRPYAAMSDVARRDNRYAIERLLELVVGAIFDVGFHLVRMRGLPAPTSYREGFSLLTANGVLSGELAVRLERAAGFRNLLATWVRRRSWPRLLSPCGMARPSSTRSRASVRPGSAILQNQAVHAGGCRARPSKHIFPSGALQTDMMVRLSPTERRLTCRAISFGI